MGLKGKTALAVFFCGLTAALLLFWYCFWTAGRENTPMDGTFVILPGIKNEHFISVPSSGIEAAGLSDRSAV